MTEIESPAHEPQAGEATTTAAELFDKSASDSVGPDGGTHGYRPNRTFPLGVEFGRQVRRRRTWIGIGLVALLPWLILLAFEIGQTVPHDPQNLANLATTSGLNFTVFTLFSSTSVLLVLVVALFFGDTVASEASWSSLQYLLASPVPRARLLRQKAIVSGIFSVLALLLLPSVAFLAGSLWYGNGELIRGTGETLSLPFGLLCLSGAVLYVAVHLSWVASLAFYLSVNTNAPLGAVGGAVLVSIFSQILDRVTALGDLRQYLPTHYSDAWLDLLSAEIEWTSVAYGAFSSLAYAMAFTLLALWRFCRKDITS